MNVDPIECVAEKNAEAATSQTMSYLRSDLKAIRCSSTPRRQKIQEVSRS